MSSSNSIYLDYQATTPTDPRVLDAMLPFFTKEFANPHSTHLMSRKPATAIDFARNQVAALIDALPEEIFFTSGATEANNQVIASVLLSSRSTRKKILIGSTEHKCIKETAYFYSNKLGFIVEEIPVDTMGRIDQEQYENALTEEVLLVCIMATNNEIGVIQDIKKLAESAHEAGALFHCDAAQAIDSIRVNVFDLGVDFLSLSAHKLYGPKGIGALFIATHLQQMLTAFVHGGGQQNGLRAGTLPTPLCVGFGQAAEISLKEFDSNTNKLLNLRTAFLNKLDAFSIDYIVNGDLYQRHPGNLNLQFPGYDADSILTSLQPYICASTGSACNSGIISSSYVLKAIGLTNEEAKSSIRFSFGRPTTEDDVKEAIQHIYKALQNRSL